MPIPYEEMLCFRHFPSQHLMMMNKSNVYEREIDCCALFTHEIVRIKTRTF